MRNREQLEQEGKLYMFMDQTPSRAADRLAVTVNHGEYIVEVEQWLWEFGLRIKQWQHTGEDEGKYVVIYFDPRHYKNHAELTNLSMQAFREFLLKDFEQMREKIDA